MVTMLRTICKGGDAASIDCKCIIIESPLSLSCCCPMTGSPSGCFPRRQPRNPHDKELSSQSTKLLHLLSLINKEVASWDHRHGREWTTICSVWFTYSLGTCQLSHTLILSEFIRKSQDHALADSMTEHFQFLTQFRLVSFTAVWVLLSEKCLKHFQFLGGLHSLLKVCIFCPPEGIFQFSEYSDHVLQIKYYLKKTL